MNDFRVGVGFNQPTRRYIFIPLRPHPPLPKGRNGNPVARGETTILPLAGVVFIVVVDILGTLSVVWVTIVGVSVVCVVIILVITTGKIRSSNLGIVRGEVAVMTIGVVFGFTNGITRVGVWVMLATFGVVTTVVNISGTNPLMRFTLTG